MAARDDNLEECVSALDGGLAEVREQVTQSAEDAAAARTLAAGADSDVSEVRAELRAHRRSLEALRDTQLETIAVMHSEFGEVRAQFGDVRAQFGEVRADFGDVRAEFGDVRAEIGDVRAQIGDVRTQIGGLRAQIGGLRTEMRAGFATMGAGMSDIVARLSRIAPDESLG